MIGGSSGGSTAVSSVTAIDYGRLADVVREEIVAWGLPANSCIAAARLCGFVLRKFGVSGVEAMACEVDAYSPAYVAMQIRAGELERPLTEAEADEFADAGAWHVMLSFGPAPPGVDDSRRGYSGHVVTLVDRAWMIDPTLPQVNRPAKDLLVDPPYAWPIDYDEARKRHVIEAQSGAIVLHRLIPGRKDFTKAGDWWRLRPDDPLVARILARLSDN